MHDIFVILIIAFSFFKTFDHVLGGALDQNPYIFKFIINSIAMQGCFAMRAIKITMSGIYGDFYKTLLS